MILLPYFVDRTSEWTKLSVFLCSGGRQLWSADGTEKATIKMLKENGFPVLSVSKESDILYAHIDQGKLKMSDFYQWTEIDPLSSEEDVWRTFIIPNSLWSCPVFKESFFKTTGLPPMGFLQ